MGRPSLDTGGEIAVIDLVAHLYATQGLRRDLCAIWDKYSAATADERKQKGFEIVRNYHSQLTRMFRDGTFDQHNTLILLRFVLIFFMRARYWSIKTRARVLLEDTSSTRREKNTTREKKKGCTKVGLLFLRTCSRAGEAEKARFFLCNVWNAKRCETWTSVRVRGCVHEARLVALLTFCFPSSSYFRSRRRVLRYWRLAFGVGRVCRCSERGDWRSRNASWNWKIRLKLLSKLGEAVDEEKRIVP